MFFSLKKQIFCNCQRVEGLQKNLTLPRDLGAPSGPNSVPLAASTAAALWPPLPPHRDLWLQGQDHPQPYLPPLLILRSKVATGSPYFCPPPLLHYLPTHTQAHPIHHKWEHGGWYYGYPVFYD